jgi:hypothetical protein
VTKVIQLLEKEKAMANNKRLFSFDITPQVQKAQANVNIPDFKGFLKGIAFHTLPKMNANHAGFTLATVENSLHTLKGTPLNVHHTQWDITGYIEDCRIGEMLADNSQPILIDSVIWKGVDAQNEFLLDVIRSVNLGESRYKLSMEVQYTDWVFVAYDPSGVQPPIILDNEELQKKKPSEVLGQFIFSGEHAGKKIGVILGGLDGQVVFNGVAITIEEITPAADQDAVILAAGTKDSMESSVVNKVLDVTNATQIAESKQEKTMDFTNMSITELLAVEGDDREAALSYLNENFDRKPVEADATETEETKEEEVAPAEVEAEAEVSEEEKEVEEKAEEVEAPVEEEKSEEAEEEAKCGDDEEKSEAPSITMEQLDGKLEQILALLAPKEEAATVEETTEEKIETQEETEEDKLLAELTEEVLEGRMTTLADILDKDYLDNEDNKTKVVNKIKAMNREAFTAYCDELKAVAEAQAKKLKAEAKAQVAQAAEAPAVNGIETNNFTFTFTQEDE